MDNKKVLFITYDGLTDPLGQSQILPYYIGLASRGYSISILSNEKKENFDAHKSLVSEKLKQAGIEWRFCFYQNQPPIIGTVANIRRMTKMAKTWHLKEQFNVVHCRSIIPAMIGDAICSNSAAKLVFDIRGFWADERVEGKLWNLSNPIYKLMYNFFKKKEKQLFKKADYIISLTENAKQYILKNFETKGKVQVIPCAADLDHFNFNTIQESTLEKLRTSLAIKDDEFVLSYIGSLGTRYRLEDMLRFFKVLKEQKTNTKFLFITRHDRNEIIEAAKRKEISEKI